MNNLGIVLEKQGKYDEAELMYRNSASDNPMMLNTENYQLNNGDTYDLATGSIPVPIRGSDPETLLVSVRSLELQNRSF
ncbi:hypothetical protein GMDG_04339 [Pseudogymnoascus destructans 20631-21]|uniref:Uncharacterized protein n=1 Tax=Pseudogymnoascus destructans (strain ATCC MYA-4855 / 20631-21) TaxID=658429 RepID=L8GAD3_PSED2|nr:hypothetical protein GMDG_04339 [Pseudogymnoascus destructans 20631-21]